MINEDLKLLEDMLNNNDPLLMEKLEEITSKYTSDSDIAAITAFASKSLSSAKKQLSKIEKAYADYTIKEKLGELDDAINFAYVARRYFGKTRSWLYQRIKGNTVNGKPAKFTDDELKQLNIALADIGNKAIHFKL